MADVSITYKKNIIAELNETTSKTLKTSGTYCEDDIKVSYAPCSRTYTLSLSKSSGWILLATLDSDVLEHINDLGLIVSLVNVSGYTYEWYSGSMYIASNTPWGYNGKYAIYGFSGRESSNTQGICSQIYYPANNTDTSDMIGGQGSFRISENKYYFKAGDGYIRAGTYKLTFVW